MKNRHLLFHFSSISQRGLYCFDEVDESAIILTMKHVLPLVIGLTIAIGFLYLIYTYLPLGIALVITAGMCAAASREADNKFIELILLFGSWLWPVGVVLTFLKNGWVLGLGSIILGFIIYSVAKTRNETQD